jgi:hypothetical protein
MKLAEKAADVKDRVADFGRKTVDKIDDSRKTAAGALDATASTLQTRGDQLSGAAHSAANKNQRYCGLRSSNQPQGHGRGRPGYFEAIPGADFGGSCDFGFLVGRVFRCNDQCWPGTPLVPAQVPVSLIFWYQHELWWPESGDMSHKDTREPLVHVATAHSGCRT